METELGEGGNEPSRLSFSTCRPSFPTKSNGYLKRSLAHLVPHRYSRLWLEAETNKRLCMSSNEAGVSLFEKSSDCFSYQHTENDNRDIYLGFR